MQPTLRQIQLPGCVRLEFAEQGQRSGLPVIALHGVTDSWRSFEPVLPHLPSDLHGDDFSARLPEIAVPSLIVRGRHDAICSAADHQAMLRLMRKCRLVEYADAAMRCTGRSRSASPRI